MLSLGTKEKLARAALILERVPKYDFAMKHWRTARPGCGTAHCVVGHAACDPWFNARGLGFHKVNSGVLILHEDGQVLENWAAAFKFFGLPDPEARYLFQGSWYHPQNFDLSKRQGGDDYEPTREEVIRRIRAYIATDGQRWVFPNNLEAAYQAAMQGIDVQDAELTTEERHLLTAYEHLKQVHHPLAQQMGLTLRALLDTRAISHQAVRADTGQETQASQAVNYIQS
jgi:hypothetical protein